MKIVTLTVLALTLLLLVPAAWSQDKPDAKALQFKLDKKVAEMKAAGASQEEIKAFVAEFKKKVEAINKAQALPDEEAFKAKVSQKAQEMKAAGASDEDIKKMVTEAKLKWEQKKAEARKAEGSAKAEKKTQ